MNKDYFLSRLVGENIEEVSQRAGIYVIHVNNKYYVGQAFRLRKRLYEHLALLKRNKHFNNYLQNLFNKYEGNLNFEIVYESKFDISKSGLRSLLTRLEQTKVNFFGSKCINVRAPERPSQLSVKGLLSKCVEFKIISPTGFAWYGFNVNSFSRSFKLDPAAIFRVLSGENSHHLGWTSSLENHLLYKQGKLITPETKRTYTLISPDGVLYEGENVKSFCLEQGLSRRSILRVVIGQRNHHLGWTSTIENHKKFTQKVRLTNPIYGEVNCFLYNISETILKEHDLKVSGHMFLRNNVDTIQDWKISYF